MTTIRMLTKHTAIIAMKKSETEGFSVNEEVVGVGQYGYGANVVCPYFKGEKGQMIYCKDEGCEEVMHMAFPTKTKCREYRHKHCEKFQSDCPIAVGLNVKWGYEVEKK